jgi:hypothetical protein
VQRVAFSLEDYKRIITETPSGDSSLGFHPFITLDEAGTALFTRDSMKGVNIEINKILQIIGKKHFSLAFVLPDDSYLDKAIRDVRIKMWLYLTDRGEVRVWLRRKYQFNDTKWVFKAKVKFSIDRSAPFWEEYENAKDAYINSWAVQPNKPMDAPKEGERIKKLREERDSLIRELAKARPADTHERLAELVGCSRPTVTRALD